MPSHRVPSVRRRLSVAAALVLCVGLGSQRRAQGGGESSPSTNPVAKPPSAAVAAEFTGHVQPLIKKFCVDCHGGAKPDGGLDLTRFSNAGAVTARRGVWEKVALRLRGEEMPPADDPQPSPRERRQLIESIDRLLARGLPGQRDPGRVTLHRLNRTEYNNTIRDLLGVDFHAGDDFPSDDVGYGFDNIGDVLTMPPPLVEKYLAAAHKIAEQAIVVPGPPPVEEHLVGKKLRSKKGAGDSFEGGGRRLASNGEIFGDCELHSDGDYLLRMMAFGDQAGDEPVKAELRVDDKILRVVDVKAEHDEPEICETPLHLSAGKHKVTVVFLNDYYEPKNPDPHRRDRNLAVNWIDVCGPLGIDHSKLPESHRRLIPREPAPENRSKDIHDFVRRFASRAFRRPAKPAEVERLKKLVALAAEHGDSFEQGMRLVLEAVLVSPHFLYRVEADPDGSVPGSIRPLNEFELASRLSYFLWSSTPDDQLLQQAYRGTLRKDGNLDAEIKRMLRDPKSQALVENFAGQWLELRMLKAFAPDAKRFPTFDEPLRTAMVEETQRFFASVLHENRSVLDFLDADYSFVNERLAKHYGLPGISGPEFRRVSLTGDQRGGLLGQASILSLTSNPTRTSPVKRGRWVLENLLGSPPPPPPPNVPPLEEKPNTPLTGTLRQRLEQHRAKAECNVCHKSMDPLGFGLENYDAIGAWRTRDGDAAIDTSGTLPGGRTFKGPRELKGILKSRQTAFTNCLAEKLLTYALGRGLEYDDQATLDDVAAATAADGYRFQTLLLAIVHSEPFQKRKVPGGPP